MFDLRDFQYRYSAEFDKCVGDSDADMTPLSRGQNQSDGDNERIKKVLLRLQNYVRRVVEDIPANRLPTLAEYAEAFDKVTDGGEARPHHFRQLASEEEFTLGDWVAALTLAGQALKALDSDDSGGLDFWDEVAPELRYAERQFGGVYSEE